MTVFYEKFKVVSKTFIFTKNFKTYRNNFNNLNFNASKRIKKHFATTFNRQLDVCAERGKKLCMKNS